MRSSSVKLIVVLVVFVAALGGALMLLRGDDSGSATKSGGGGGDAGSGGVVTSDIWAVGDAWTVKVEQDAGAISPDGDANVATIPFEFSVIEAPAKASGEWVVKVEQEGAEGPFANGWRLHYVDKDGVMTLVKVATGKEPPLEAELAAIVLGPQFPYETTYEAAPKDATLDVAALMERATLPPDTLPGTGTPDDAGATPPAEAPKLDAGGAPAAP